ncbi:MAG: DUF4474 domain-containing protein [Clostridia bacterium]|nr:DUF4474 domain-containing protein [Clostridia bacterium]
MKKLIRTMAILFICMLMLVSSAGLSMASAVGNVKTLTLKSASASAVTLQWSAVSGAKGYRVYKYIASQKKWKAVKTTTSRSYKDTAIVRGEIYQYRVKAYEIKNEKKVFSEKYSNTVKAVIAPKKVTGLKATSIKSTSVILKWNKTDKATGYRVYKYNPTSKKYEKLGDTAETSYSVTGLDSNTTYKFKVKAYTKSGKTKYGSASNAATVKTRPADVKSFRLSKSTADSYTLSWGKSKGVSGYQLQKYNESTQKWVSVKRLTSTSYTVSDASGVQTKYRLRTYVKSDNKYTYGAFSKTVTGSCLPGIPEDLKAAVNSDNGISLTWSKVSGASGYTVYSYSAQNGSWSTAGSTKTNTFTVKNIKNTDTYRYAVSSYIYINGQKLSSEKCESVSILFESKEKPDSIYSEEMEKSGILGYLYDPKEGCFYTSADPWQRVVGYNSVFDVMGPFTLIDFDTVRLRFEYQNKDWMIQLWKGQYGLVFYGAEVGVYTKPKDRDVMHYDAASDSEMLKMSMTFIEKNNKGVWKEKFTRPYGDYWWCTGFLPGTRYGKYDRMKLDMRITMKDYEMLSGVTTALKENNIDYTVQGLDVYFVYE